MKNMSEVFRKAFNGELTKEEYEALIEECPQFENALRVFLEIDKQEQER